MAENPQNPQAEVVEVVQPPNGARWSPIVGPETTQLLRHLGLEAGSTTVRDQALGIMSRCVPPTVAAGTDTNLVVGFVQSGKTISFTTVAALARDNGYHLVIVIAGVTNFLYGQSKTRLEKDLRLNDRPDRPWVHFPKPTPVGNTIGNIQGMLQAWRDPTLPGELKPTVLITVMKNKPQLNKLTAVLSGLNLTGVPTLVIDDEADQAGLNTFARRGDSSPTYSSLLALRQTLPHHTFLQYTATPQAPLLINLIDMLSPSYASVLTPGASYVGGRQFFVESPALVRRIPGNEIPTEQAPLLAPPETLQEAMKLFFLGVASGFLRGGRKNRSMMVHPSMKTLPHSTYLAWVVAIKNNWEGALQEGGPDREDVIDSFRAADANLRATVADLEPFDDLCRMLLHAIRSTLVHEVNSNGPTSEINWRGVYPHILVGGEILGRGFTVEGLTVTYMPRGVGVGNADTVQQRARFFGYKREYLDFCRVFLEQEVADAYRKYVDHEQDIHDRLVSLPGEGKTLVDWRRAFFLDSDLRPTRGNVLDLDYMQAKLSDAWFYPAAPHYSASGLALNRQLTQALIDGLQWEPDAGHPARTEMQKHLVARNVPLRRLFTDYLTCLSVASPDDSQPYTGALLQIEAYLRANQGATCTIYRMSPGHDRRRELDDNGEIKTLFQGEYPVEKARRGEIYQGDKAIVVPEGLTLQIHSLTLHSGGPDIETRVPTIALWIPADMAKDWLVQKPGASV